MGYFLYVLYIMLLHGILFTFFLFLQKAYIVSTPNLLCFSVFHLHLLNMNLVIY